MPLSDQPLTLRGGCNCQAIRYNIHIPERSARPVHPTQLEEKAAGSFTWTKVKADTKECRMPFVCFDHCNNCRSTTGSILPAWICAPASMVEVSCVPASSESVANPVATGTLDPTQTLTPDGEERPPFKPGLEMLLPSESNKTFIRYYHSSNQRTRSFCGRCGTPISCNFSPAPNGWVDIIHIFLGTLDRTDLQKYSMVPERQIWWDYGIPWTKGLLEDMKGQKHEDYRVDICIDE